MGRLNSSRESKSEVLRDSAGRAKEIFKGREEESAEAAQKEAAAEVRTRNKINAVVFFMSGLCYTKCNRLMEKVK